MIYGISLTYICNGFQDQWRFEKNNVLKFFSIGTIKDGEEKCEFRQKNWIKVKRFRSTRTHSTELAPPMSSHNCLFPLLPSTITRIRLLSCRFWVSIPTFQEILVLIVVRFIEAPTLLTYNWPN